MEKRVTEESRAGPKFAFAIKARQSAPWPKANVIAMIVSTAKQAKTETVPCLGLQTNHVYARLVGGAKAVFRGQGHIANIFRLRTQELTGEDVGRDDVG